MIAMRNGTQSGATLYASSRSAQGTSGPDFRLEMEVYNTVKFLCWQAAICR